MFQGLCQRLDKLHNVVGAEGLPIVPGHADQQPLEDRKFQTQEEILLFWALEICAGSLPKGKTTRKMWLIR